MYLTPLDIPQRLLQQLFELDADCAEALWALDQPSGEIDLRAMLRDTLAALEQIPKECSRFRKNLPPRARPILASLEPAVRLSLNPSEAYNGLPSTHPQTG